MAKDDDALGNIAVNDLDDRALRHGHAGDRLWRLRIGKAAKNFIEHQGKGSRINIAHHGHLQALAAEQKPVHGAQVIGGDGGNATAGVPLDLRA